MSAIIRLGSKQLTVEEGDRVKVERLEAEKGSTVEIEDVLAVMAGSEVNFGKPLVDGAKVQAKVVSHGRGNKIIVFKFRPKKRYRLTRGHRQDYTELQIEKIIVPGAGKTTKKKKDTAEAEDGS